MVYVIIATTLVCVLFDPVIPTSSFNFIKMFFILVIITFNKCMGLLVKPSKNKLATTVMNIIITDHNIIKNSYFFIVPHCQTLCFLYGAQTTWRVQRVSAQGRLNINRILAHMGVYSRYNFHTYV